MRPDVVDQMRIIERLRESRVLLIMVSQLELGLLPTLYEILDGIGPQRRLDVVIYCLGGIPSAARRIALLFHGAAVELTFIVADRCESSGTILVTSGHHVIAGPVAIFTPIDPLLPVEGSASAGPSGVAAEDVRRLPEIISEWFGIDLDTARREALTLLGGAIFPPTLSSFRRAVSEVEEIATTLTMLGAAAGDPIRASRIVQGLMHGYHSHGFALAREDLAAMGMPMLAEPAVEQAAWKIIGALRPALDPARRQDRAVPHDDAVIATTTSWATRRRQPATGAPDWTAEASG